jgi:uncharacterized membrane protein (UPF0127 family)
VTFRAVLIAAAMTAAVASCRAEPQTQAALAAARPAAGARSPAGLELVGLEIESQTGRHRFSVEVARTPEEQARGLMFRQSLGPAEGMIFPFAPPRPASFWMKNTLIPLDMLFVRADGIIAFIAPNTVPHSEQPVGVGEPVAAVLEIAGGRAYELGIREGDKVSWASNR